MRIERYRSQLCFYFFSRASTKRKHLCRVHCTHCFLENYLDVILMDTTLAYHYSREYFKLPLSPKQ